MNNLPKVVTQQRRGRASNPRLLDRKSDALPISHRATHLYVMTVIVGPLERQICTDCRRPSVRRPLSVPCCQQSATVVTRHVLSVECDRQTVDHTQRPLC